MHRVQRSVAALVVGAGLVTGAAVAGAPAQAAPVSHLTHARTDWIKGAHVAAAVEGRYWQAARTELSRYGTRYEQHRQELAALAAIPLTDATDAQRADAARFTRYLNSFFHTPGLYGVKPALSHRARAKVDWVRSFAVSSAEQGRYLEGAAAHLAHYGTTYAVERRQLMALDDIPLTSTTKKQRADAVRLVRALNGFFGTHYEA